MFSTKSTALVVYINFMIVNSLAALGLPGGGELLILLTIPIVSIGFILCIACFGVKCANEFVRGLNDVKQNRR